MRYHNLLIAFAFIAISANVHGAPIDMPLQNVQGLTSLTNLNSLQGINPQTLSSLSDGKSSGFNLDQINSKLSSLPLQSLPVGGSTDGKSSPLDLSTANQLLSSGALSNVKRDDATLQESKDNGPGSPNMLQTDQITNQLMETITKFMSSQSTQDVGNSSPTKLNRRDDTTPPTGQSSIIPNTDSLRESITKVISSMSLGGGESKTTTNSLNSRSPQGGYSGTPLTTDQKPSSISSPTNNGLSSDQTQQITQQIMEMITKFMSMSQQQQQSPTSLMRRAEDISGQTSSIPNSDALRESIMKVLSSINLTNLGGKQSSTDSTMPSSFTNVIPQMNPMGGKVLNQRRAEDTSNGLSSFQTDQITNQVMDIIKNVMGGTQSNDKTNTMTTTNNIVPSLNSRDENSVIPKEELQNTVVKIVSAINMAKFAQQQPKQKRDETTNQSSDFSGFITKVTDVKSLPDNKLLIFGFLNQDNSSKTGSQSPVSGNTNMFGGVTGGKSTKRDDYNPAGTVNNSPKILDIKTLSGNVVAILAQPQSHS